MKNFMVISLFTLIIFWGCGSDNKTAEEKMLAEENEVQLTPFELENGIGPIKEKIKLAAIDKKIAAEGEKIFNEKCASCHKLDEKYVGPAQRDVLTRRTPEYIMNMILNPQENINKHPEAKKMLAQYLTPMTFQNVTQDDARKILEFFRLVNTEKPIK